MKIQNLRILSIEKYSINYIRISYYTVLIVHQIKDVILERSVRLNEIGKFIGNININNIASVVLMVSIPAFQADGSSSNLGTRSK